jgi:hypothetical protein
MKKMFLLLVITMVLSVGLAFSQAIPYVGDWFIFDDRDNNGGSSTVAMTEGTKDGMTTYTFKGRTTTQYSYGFAGWGSVPNAATLADLKVAKSISFKCIGDGKRYTVKYRLDESTVKDYGNHEFHFNTREGREMTVEVPIRMFMQPAWAEKVSMNQSKVMDIAWQTHEGWRPDTFEITIWDLRINK